MGDLTPDRIAVTFSMTADDYARYFEVMNRKHSGGFVFLCCLTGFGAIPVALAFRWLELRLSGDAAAAEMVGRFSLLAFLLGIVAVITANIVAERNATGRYLAATLNAFESKTATFDARGMTITGQISQSMWQWAAVSRFTIQRGLFLIWIGSTGVAIPTRSFASDDACEAAAAFIRAHLAKAKPAAGAPGAQPT